jgi:hypothetical protein
MEIPKNNQAVLEINREDSMSSDLIDDNNRISLVWYILSISSWALFSCCLLESYLNDPSLNNTKYYHRTISLPTVKIFITSLNLVGFIIYLIFTSCKKDRHLYKSMFRGITKFHFVPLLLTSALLILQHISISFEIISETNQKNILISDLVIALLALGTFIITYIGMHLPCEWYIVLAIKKGTFSCLIPYLLYNSLFDIVILIEKEETAQIIAIISMILLAVVSLSLSCIFKDIIIAFINALIYAGFIIFCASLNFENSKIKKLIIIFIWLILGISEISSITIIGILLSRFKEKIFK